MLKRTLLSLSLCLLFPSGWLLAEYQGFAESILQRLESQFGLPARKRVESWENLMVDPNLKQASDQEKLKRVNNFFNQNRFLDDITVWGQQDYWATPLEFLSRNAGDCEDYSIAKYLTLLELGIPESKMRLMYVKALKLNQAHMVLLYYPSANAVPLVLDNLIPDIRPANTRNDLLPVYSFNGSGLWINKKNSAQKVSNSADRIGPWRDLERRLRDERRPPAK
ncbi:transglutaminase-like cysteine peptidase [Balneatrix alpica]|uniref:Transglutaminase-like cysteine peptidase n=1 Tax=Balneatrix alpica TaxID=75684 RepID=A0ABV5ZIU0_9GAMM|nr:transglutaminase-like cysteine peptidase [Balneatrix alpica]